MGESMKALVLLILIIIIFVSIVTSVRSDYQHQLLNALLGREASAVAPILPGVGASPDSIALIGLTGGAMVPLYRAADPLSYEATPIRWLLKRDLARYHFVSASPDGFLIIADSNDTTRNIRVFAGDVAPDTKGDVGLDPFADSRALVGDQAVEIFDMDPTSRLSAPAHIVTSGALITLAYIPDDAPDAAPTPLVLCRRSNGRFITGIVPKAVLEQSEEADHD